MLMTNIFIDINRTDTNGTFFSSGTYGYRLRLFQRRFVLQKEGKHIEIELRLSDKRNGVLCTTFEQCQTPYKL